METTILLGTFLYDLDIGHFQDIQGESQKFGRHHWLQNRKIIIDITAYQFDGINEEIIVEYNHNYQCQFNIADKSSSILWDISLPGTWYQEMCKCLSIIKDKCDVENPN